MGSSPESNDHLDWMFAESIYQRFNIISNPPDLRNFQDALNLDGKEF